MAQALQHDQAALIITLQTASPADFQPIPATPESGRTDAINSLCRWYKISVRPLALLRHIVETRIKADVVTSADTLRELCDNPTTPPTVLRQCANDLLDRAGILVEKFSTVHHVVEQRSEPTGTHVMQMIRNIAPDMGIGLVVRHQDKLDRFLAAAIRVSAGDHLEIIEGQFEHVEEDE